MSGYGEAGASGLRRALRGFIANSLSPSLDIDAHNTTLRQRGRMLYMGSPIATSAINTNRTKIIGTGLTLKSAVHRELLAMSPEQAKAFQKRAEAEFRLWADKKEHCDATGMNNLAGIQQLCVLSWLMSGDVFVLIKRAEPTKMNPYTLRLHVVEADRICTPSQYGIGRAMQGTDGINQENSNKIHDGVEVDSNGRVVAYHVARGYPRQFNREKLEWDRIEAIGEKTGLPNILHIMSSERADQYRGITYLAQVIEPLLQINRYTQSELVAALVQSFFTAWVTTQTSPSEIPFNETGSGIVNQDGSSADAPGISAHENELEMGPGTIHHLAEGETVTFGNPNIPSTGFDSFVKSITRIIGSALEIPYEVLSKEFNSSYSASRAALMEAWESIMMRRAWIIDDLCQPVYDTWLAEAVARGRIKAPGFFTDPLLRSAWSGAHWIGPVQGHLDPVKEIRADRMAINCGVKTHEQVTRQYGMGDWEENADQLQREKEKLAQIAQLSEPNPDAPDRFEEDTKKEEKE